RPGDPETRRPGDPETRRPGDPETRRPGDPETLFPALDASGSGHVVRAKSHIQHENARIGRPGPPAVRGHRATV
ncbi:hypothetical protein ACFU7B_39025, partial [Streptomyces sp. NPDC057545]